MVMNIGQRVVKINAYVDYVVMIKSLADRKPFTGKLLVLKVHQLFENEFS